MWRHGGLPAFIALYGLLYAGFGVASPFWPAFFESRGFAPEEIGALFASGMLVRLAVGPLAARVADLFGSLRVILTACAAVAAGLALALLMVQQIWPLALVRVAQEASLAPTTLLADALALNAATRAGAGAGFEYGWVRGTGSAAFVVGTLVAGQFLGPFGISVFLWMHAGLIATSATAVAFVPPLRGRSTEPFSRKPSAFAGVRELLALPVFRRMMILAGLVYGSHATHDTFAVISWRAAGIGPTAASVLWSEAVIAEVVVFFWAGPALVNRLGTAGAAVLAAGAGVVRWTVMGETTAVSALAVVEPLHGLTFALLHLACMRIIALAVPVRLAATGQALYAVGAGISTALLTLLSGRLYGVVGAHGFLAMSLLCGFALPVAFGLRCESSRCRQQDAT